MSICRGICVLLSAHWQYSYHHPQWMEKRRRKNHPQAFPHPAPSCETMHLNTASGLSLFRPDFLFGALLLHFHSIHFLYSNPVKGKSDKVTCLSCFRGLLERTSYSKPYFLVYHPSTWKRRFVDFFFSWSRSVTALLSWSKLPCGWSRGCWMAAGQKHSHHLPFPGGRQDHGLWV